MLFFTLTLFIALLSVGVNQSIIQMQTTFELLQRPSIERFSLLETYILSHTVKHFHGYHSDDLVFDFDEGRVLISIVDESAYLRFDFENPIYARLDYDLVFDSAINYVYIDESEYLLIDKNAD